MEPTTALIIVAVLVGLALVAAAGGFARTTRTRRTVVERPVQRPVERVVERPAREVVVEDPAPARRVVE